MSERLLLHCCCAPCAGAVIEKLAPDFALTLFFPEDNIWPAAEQNIRAAELQKFADKLGLPLINSLTGYESWRQQVGARREDLPEGGLRCAACFRWRFEKLARAALQHGFTRVATTLSISPHKNTAVVNSLLAEVAQKHGLQPLLDDFSGLFSRSCEISRQENFYRQRYCGCEFSVRK